MSRKIRSCAGVPQQVWTPDFGLVAQPSDPVVEPEGWLLRRRCSLLRHPGFAEPGEIGAFPIGIPSSVESAGAPIGLEARDAEKMVVAGQTPGFGEFGCGALGLAGEAIGRGTEGMRERQFRDGDARL